MRMTDDAHTPRTAAAAARTSDTAGAHADGPVCAFPGCDSQLELSSEPGRPASYCGGTTTGPDGRNYPHDRTGAYRWKRKYGQQAAGAEPARAATSSTGGSGGEWSAAVARQGAAAQARELAAALEQLPVQLDRYVQVLQHAADPDAVAADADRQRRQYERDLAAAEQARDDATADADAALAEKAEAEQIADEALTRAEDAETETARAREAVADAQADAARAREDAQRARTEFSEVRAAAERDVKAAQDGADQDAEAVRAERDRILSERAHEHEQQLDRVRTDAHRDVRDAQLQQARAQQAADDATADAERLRTELDRQRAELAELRKQHREELIELREQHRADRADDRAELERLRADHGHRVSEQVADETGADNQGEAHR